MFRRAAVLVVALLSTAAVGAAVAQDSAAAAKPAAKAAHKMHMAKQDTTQKPAAKPAAKPTWTKEQIKEAQAGLIKAGLYKGDTSGVMNAATRKALRAYQKQNKMRVTGTLSDSVLAKLRGS